MKTKTKKLLVVLLSLALVLSSLAIVISAAVSGSEDDSKKINVWLIAGQSNAVGFGKVAEYSGSDGELLDKGVENVLQYSAGYEGFVPVSFGLGQNGENSGAELGLATALANSGEMHAIIKYADGDTQLSALNVNSTTNVSTWTPPSYIKDNPEIKFEGDKIGDLYNGLIATVTSGIAKLKADGYTPVVQGIWWMQGERDSNLGSMTSELYSELLGYLVSDLRADVGEIVGKDLSTLPFVYGRVYLNPAYTAKSEEGLAAVTAAQDAFAADANNVNVAMLDTRSDLIDFYTQKQVAPVQQDQWHYDAYTQQLMGEALVRKVSAMKPDYTDTKSVSILKNEQALYTATLNYIIGAPVSLKLGSTSLFSISESGMSILGAEVKGTYGPGDYTVYACVNPAQDMTMVEVKLPDGGILRKGVYGKTSGASIVAASTDAARIKNVSLKYERLTLNEYELVTVEPGAEGFAANVYNLMNSFSDATSSRLFAWTAKAEFIGERTMAIKYRVKGTSDWTVADAYKLDEPTPYADEDYFKVEIYGLSANSEYEYKIGVKDSSDEVNEWSKLYTFKTAKGDEKEFTFIAVGDTQGITWGGTETANKGFMYTKAAFDEAFEEVENPAFILHTGDVVEEGLKEEQWNYYFKALGEAGASVPHFATVGNHDDNLATADQNFYFGMHLNHPNNGGNAYLDPTVVSVINSLDPETAKDAKWVQLIIKYMDETFYSYNYGDAHFVVYNSGAYSSQDELMLKAQRAWLKADLEANKDAKWTVVLAHQGVYHRYGGGYNRNTLADIIEGFDVDLVIQGHSHLVTRSYPMKDGKIVTKENPNVVTKGDGTVYMLIGATALNHDRITDYPNMEDQAVTVSNVGTQPCYTVFNVTENSIDVSVKQVDGLVLDKFSIVEPEEEEPVSENVVYNDDFHYFTYNDLAALGLWETEVYSSTVKYTAKAPSYSSLRLKLSDKQSVQFNWLKAIGGIQNYDPNDTYVFEFDANVTNWGANSASSTRTLYVAPGGYYNQVGLHHSDTTMQVGEGNNGVHPSYTYSGEETFHIKIEWHGKTIISTVTDTKGTTITGSREKDNYVNVATDPLLQTMVFRCEDGTVYIDNFSFKSLSDVEIDGYGTIPSNYADASVYPIVLFQGGVFKGAFGANQFKEASEAARALVPLYDGVQENAPAAAKILLRGDVVATGNDANLGQAVGEIDINLGGYTLYQTGGSHLFYLRTKTYSSHAQKVTLNVYGGNIELSGFLFGVGAQQNNSSMADTYTTLKNADINFKNVNITITTRGKGWSVDALFQDQTGTNYSADKQVDFNAVFEDCVLDYSKATTSSIFFSLNHASSTVNAIDLTLRGGEIKLSKAAANTKLYELNAVSSIAFEAGSDGEYLKISLPNGVAGSVLTNTDLAIGTEKASFIKQSTDSLRTTYALEGTGEVQGVYIDGYGILPNAYADAKQYPIVIFQNGQFQKAFGEMEFHSALSYPRAYLGLKDEKDPAPARILLRGNATTTTKDENLGQTAGVIDINLNGFTLTHGHTSYLFYTRTKTVNNFAQKFTLNVYNGNIVLGGQFFVIGTQNGGTTTGPNKDAELNFSNLNISLNGVIGTNSWFVTPSSGTVSGTSDPTAHFDVRMNDCLFNLKDLFKANQIFQLGASYTTVNFEINGGEMQLGKGGGSGTKPYSTKLYTLDTGASITLGKGSDGKYLKITTPSDVTAGIITNVATPFYTDAPITSAGSTGAAAQFVNPVTVDGWTTYTLQPEVYVDGYGTVTPTYSDASKYTILVFKGDEFIQGFVADQFKEALGAARGLVPSHTDEQDNTKPAARILLLADAISTAREENLGQAVGTIDVNLNGYTLIQNHDGALFWLRTKTYSNYQQTFTFKVRNGSISLRSYLFAVGTQNNSGSSYMSGQFKNGEILFENVDLNVQRGMSLPDSLVLFTNGSVGDGTADKSVEYDIDFNDCVFDLSGVTANTCVLNFNFTSTKATPAVDLSLNGGEIKLSSNIVNTSLYNLNPESSISFGKGTDGKYMSVSTPGGVTSSAVAGEFTDVGNNKFVFVKISESRDEAVYRLTPKTVADLEFTPKMSLTLDRNLILNVYVPAKDFLNSFTVDGKSSEEYDLEKVEIDGQDYYLVSIELDAKEAARSVVLKAYVTIGDKEASGTFTFSIIKYAEKILAGGSTVEKTLVRDVLSYVRAAYTYFGTDDAAAISSINAILGENYDENNAPAAEGSTVANAPAFKSVTFVLNGTPSIRFYLNDGDDASKYEFFIDGANVNVEVSADGKYIDIDVYAYELCETVTYTADGSEGGSFHINAYYEWSKTQNDDALVNVVARFYKYCQSARAYRDSVIGK